MNRCDYAACRRAVDAAADGWWFCKPHLFEHRHLLATDVQIAAERGPRPDPIISLPPPGIVTRYDGQLSPCGTYLPLFAVLNRRPIRQQAAS